MRQRMYVPAVAALAGGLALVEWSQARTQSGAADTIRVTIVPLEGSRTAYGIPRSLPSLSTSSAGGRRRRPARADARDANARNAFVVPC